MIKLEVITEENYVQVMNLELKDSQKYFLSTNERSLAEAYVYRNDGVSPFAVIDGEEIIGFIMFDLHDDDPETYIIWRMMIDDHNQGKGYGKKLLEVAKQYTKNQGFKSLIADYVQGNEAMKKNST